MTETGEKWRLFVAISIPAEIKRKLDDWCRQRRDWLPFRKWVHAEDYHITVQFLGDMPPDRLGELEASLRKAVIGVASFSLKAGGCGTFGRPASPSVLWAGVKGDLPALGRLHRQVTEANRELGFVPEERRYSPHITLARKYREDAAAINAEALQGDAAFGSWTADRLVVYRTHMHERPMYETVATVSFSQ